MSRILLNYLLPLVLPLVVYLSYMWWRRRRTDKHDTNIPIIGRNQVFISILIGFLLMVFSMSWIAFTSGATPGEGEYRSPRYENGKVIPPSFN